MLIHEKKAFTRGAVMSLAFLAVLGVMFSPLFGGKNAFEASDQFFNSIAKGSTYYIPGLLKQNDTYSGKTIDVSIRIADKQMASQVTKVLSAADAQAKAAEAQLQVTGNLGQITKAAIQDADAMFYNRGRDVTARYGIPEKEVLFVWSLAFKEMERDLKRQKRFEEARWLGEVSLKGLEVGYNFYGIAPKKASSTAGMLSLSMLFYIVYTLWWGFAILYLCEGIGLQMKPGAKKEV
jgi:hypothetical protein